MTQRELPREALAAVGLLALDALARTVAGGPYLGATLFLLLACGVSLLPLLPRELGSPSLRLAVVPALALGSYALLLTTVSVVGIRLTEVSIRVAVLGLVLALAAVARMVPREKAPRSTRKEGIAIAALGGSLLHLTRRRLGRRRAVSAAGLRLGLLPPPAPTRSRRREVSRRRIPTASANLARSAATPASALVYGSLRILDGVSSESLARGLVVAVALTPLAVYAAVGALWGVGAGLLAAVAYAVAPIHLEPLYWHGLATTLGLLFLPLVVLALGLQYRGRRDRRVVGLLGFSLASLAVMHSVSAGVVAVLLALVAPRGCPRWIAPSPGRYEPGGGRGWRNPCSRESRSDARSASARSCISVEQAADLGAR